MKKPENGPPLDSREFLSFARGKLGDSFLVMKFKADGGQPISLRTLDHWTSDPRYASDDSIRKNPIEKLEETLTVLMERGHRIEVRGLVGRFAEISKCTLYPNEQIQIDRDEDIRDTILNGGESLQKLHSMMRKWASPDAIRAQGLQVVEEIIRTLEQYDFAYEVERHEQWRTDADDRMPNGERFPAPAK
jgi:hypothetical protein